uniref:Gastrokine 2 n=1 Tax=Malurus cyaneus samueli TaxID=2593467 RepID=A0A8C5UEE3_9PASS
MILCFSPKSFVLRDPVSNYVTGTMTIHNEESIVDVHVRSGVYSSDTIFDYSRGYIATKLFSRNACFIMKIKKEYIPELEEIGRLAFERQVTVGNPLMGHLKDWIIYGKHIEKLCTGLPLYQLVATERKLQIQALWFCPRAPSYHFNLNPRGTLELYRHFFPLSYTTNVLYSFETKRDLE